MAELVTAGGFETYDPAWVFVSGARTSLLQHTGSWSGACQTSRQPIFGGGWSNTLGSITQGNLTFVAGVQYSYSAWVFVGPGWDADGAFEIDHGGGYTVQHAYSKTIAGDWVNYSGTFEAVGGTGAVRLRNYNPVDNSNGNTYLDDVTITGSDAMAVTKNLKNNMVTALTGLTVRSGVTIQDVFLEPKRRDEIERWPVIFLIPGDGGKAELETISNRYGSARQVFILQYMDRTDSPNDDLDDATDAIRNAIESSASALEAMNETIDIVVESWSPVISTDELTSGGIYYRTHDISIGYVYERGSA